MNPPYFVQAKVERPALFSEDPDACLSMIHPKTTSIMYDEIPSDDKIKSDVATCGCPVTIIRKSWETPEGRTA